MSKNEQLLVHAEVIRDIDYNPLTGVFTWKVKPNKNKQKGDVIGGRPTNTGYLRARYKKKLFFQHRLAWFYVYGVWPVRLIDHKNGNKADNRIDNLREASHTDNKANIKLRQDNKAGYKGVSWSSRDKYYLVQLSYEGKRMTIGYFHDLQEAADAYDKAAIQYFGEYALTNKMLGEGKHATGTINR